MLSGDSAEFQLVAAILGVAHPTTYPLYTLLGHLMTVLVPFGDLAWRVTLLSAVCAAAAIGVQCGLARRLGLAWPAALIGAVALGVTPGLWNAATLAEVYALLALLLLLLAYVLRATWPTEQGARESSQPAPLGLRVLALRYGLPAMIAGLGFTHHGLFAITALPIVAIWALLHMRRQTPRQVAGILVVLAVGFLLGCTPWLYPLIQYTRFGPFTGEDYGLPRHYYWGAPQSIAQVVDLLTGGTVRRGIFRIPTGSDALATISMLRERATFEFGPIGLVLALVGVVALVRRARWAWFASCWVVLATASYLFLLGPAVEDAPIFTLPMLLPISLWIAGGVDLLLGLARDWAGQIPTQLRQVPRAALVLLLVGWLLWWGDSRVEYSSKRHLNLYRTFSTAVLADLPPDAVVLAHWEQGMALQYLHLVEQQRPDVWIDVVEPTDRPWGPRAASRYADRPVFLIGQAGDVAGLPVELVREDDYALVFRLRK
jgi:hypothetical protein